MPGFLLWSVVCLAGSSDAAGSIGGAVVARAIPFLGLGAYASVVAGLCQKAAHLGLFLMLGLLAGGEAADRRRRWVMAAGLVVCLAAELLQGLTATRHPRVTDMAINLAAYGAGVWMTAARPRLAK